MGDDIAAGVRGWTSPPWTGSFVVCRRWPTSGVEVNKVEPAPKGAYMRMAA
jgi:hypothetical protein